jgi:hypothetical protein
VQKNTEKRCLDVKKTIQEKYGQKGAGKDRIPLPLGVDYHQQDLRAWEG